MIKTIKTVCEFLIDVTYNGLFILNYKLPPPELWNTVLARIMNFNFGTNYNNIQFSIVKSKYLIVIRYVQTVCLCTNNLYLVRVELISI